MRTFVCIGCGPSLTAADVLACRGQATIIAINNAWILAPWADILLGGDQKWWDWHNGCPSFGGDKYTCHRLAAHKYKDVIWLRPSGLTGFEWDRGFVATGGNSGYVAIQMAAQMGAMRILLLGYDMQPSPRGEDHWHAPHPDGSHPSYRRCLPRFETLVEPLAQRGIEVFNCSRATALTVFPRLTIEQALTRPSSPSTRPNLPEPNALSLLT